ncbi:MAG: hypothetical protein ACI9VR_000440 [Cognaticolwellia sp.]|jgi:hypothetical protein
MLLALLLSCLPKPAGLSELTPEHDALVLAWTQALDAGDLAQLGPHLHPVSAQTLSGGFDRPQALAHLLPRTAEGRALAQEHPLVGQTEILGAVELVRDRILLLQRPTGEVMALAMRPNANGTPKLNLGPFLQLPGDSLDGGLPVVPLRGDAAQAWAELGDAYTNPTQAAARLEGPGLPALAKLLCLGSAAQLCGGASPAVDVARVRGASLALVEELGDEPLLSAQQGENVWILVARPYATGPRPQDPLRVAYFVRNYRKQGQRWVEWVPEPGLNMALIQTSVAEMQQPPSLDERPIACTDARVQIHLVQNSDARLIACLDNLVDVQLGPGRMSLALDDGAVAAWLSQDAQAGRIQVRVDGQAWPEIFAPEPSYSLGVMMPAEMDSGARLAIEERLRGWISE